MQRDGNRSIVLDVKTLRVALPVQVFPQCFHCHTVCLVTSYSCLEALYFSIYKLLFQFGFGPFDNFFVLFMYAIRDINVGNFDHGAVKPAEFGMANQVSCTIPPI